MKYILLFIITIFINAQNPNEHIVIINFDSVIHHGLANYFDKVISKTNDKTKALVINLNTPGGDLQATERIIEQFFKVKYPIILYVTPSTGSATSAGVFLASAAHKVFMTPGSSIGSAHPIQGNGTDIKGDLRKKIENYAVTKISTNAKMRGRNVEWYKKAVLESDSLNAKEALEKNVIDGLANNIEELLSKLELANYERVSFKPELVDRVLFFITDPTLMSLLWMMALLGIGIEMYNPGLVLPGLVGVISLVLSFMAMNLITVNTTGFTMLVIGAILILVEVFVVSGLFGAAGVLATAIGMFFVFDVNSLWGVKPNLFFIYFILLIFVSIFAYIALELLKIKNKSSDLIVGSLGVVFKDLPNGKVEINGVLWNADAQIELKKDTKIKVISRTGLKLFVEQI